jgi:hypothetical protein
MTSRLTPRSRTRYLAVRLGPDGVSEKARLLLDNIVSPEVSLYPPPCRCLEPKSSDETLLAFRFLNFWSSMFRGCGQVRLTFPKRVQFDQIVHHLQFTNRSEAAALPFSA